jgi:hypothetical protein
VPRAQLQQTMQWQLHKEIYFLVVSYIAVISGTVTGSYEEGSYSSTVKEY